MNKDGEQFYGMAVVCDSIGRVKQVLRNDLCEDVPLEENASLSMIVDPQSVQKFFTFVYRLNEEKALYDWDINITCKGSTVKLYLVGGVHEENLLIVASTSRQVADSYFVELMEMNNEQTNYIRSSVKQAHQSVITPGNRRDDEFYRDFSRLNNELANLQRDLQRKNRKLQETIAERDRYIGMAVHDLRNPLSAFSSICTLLLDGDMGELNAEQQEVVELMRQNAQHMLAMVSDMLDISTIQSGTLQLTKEPVQLTSVLESSVSLNRQLAKKKAIHVQLQREDDLPSVQADRVKIAQVLDNLISNAIKYSYPETTITVRVYQAEGSLVVEVEDEGQGIPDSEMPKLFVPYSKINVSATDGEKSTGLGLAITKNIVEGHGGTLTVESVVGQGSTFRFTLPT